MRPSPLDAAFIAYSAMDALNPVEKRKAFTELPIDARTAMRKAVEVEYELLDSIAADPTIKRPVSQAIQSVEQKRAQDVFIAVIGAVYWL